VRTWCHLYRDGEPEMVAAAAARAFGD